MYLIHQAMQDHALAAELGGLGGYKLGAVGVIPGETAISAPLFKKFIVDAPDGVSAGSIQAHNLEAGKTRKGALVRPKKASYQ
jgi:hypothetical protein